MSMRSDGGGDGEASLCKNVLEEGETIEFGNTTMFTKSDGGGDEEALSRKNVSEEGEMGGDGDEPLTWKDVSLDPDRKDEYDNEGLSQEGSNNKDKDIATNKDYNNITHIVPKGTSTSDHSPMMSNLVKDTATATPNGNIPGPYVSTGPNSNARAHGGAPASPTSGVNAGTGANAMKKHSTRIFTGITLGTASLVPNPTSTNTPTAKNGPNAFTIVPARSSLGCPVVNVVPSRSSQNFATMIPMIPMIDGKYPQDNYSFIALNGPTMNGNWSRKKFLFFLFGLIPFVFQVLFLVILVLSETDELRGTIGENDNPDSDSVSANQWMGAFASFIPANANPVIRLAQLTAIWAYVLFPGSSLKDLVRAVHLFPRSSNVHGGTPVGCAKFSCILRGTQGIIAMLVTLLLIVTSNAVVDIILNFTAVNFISDLDDHAFRLAMSGEFGPALQAESQKIARTDLPHCMYRDKKPKHTYNLFGMGFAFVVMFGMFLFVTIAQNSNEFWVTKILRVQFQETTGLDQYSGCFGINKYSSSILFSRRFYDSFEQGPGNTSFGYCRADRQWVLFPGNSLDPCDAIENDLELARSSKTDSFDISTSFDEPWLSASNTPLDMYFFDGDNEIELLEHCDSFLGDGRCDPFLNELGYNFDGGDCCAATCAQSNCGRSFQTFAFGQSNGTEVGFPNCTDPGMVPITIHLNEITSSRVRVFNDAWNSFNGFDESDWRQEIPESPYFSLMCNNSTVLTVYINEGMANQSETVMVEDGATCSLLVRNRTASKYIDLLNDDPIWFVDYTIFHGEKNDDEKIEILSEHSMEKDRVYFKRIPECYFKKLGNFTDAASIYKDVGASNEAIDWLVEIDKDNTLCEKEDMFVERYGLTKFFFGFNGTENFIQKENQCTWPSIRCSQGQVEEIEVMDATLTGNFPTEIHMFGNLKELKLGQNSISMFPNEIPKITNLEKLDLCKPLLMHQPCFNFLIINYPNRFSLIFH